MNTCYGALALAPRLMSALTMQRQNVASMWLQTDPVREVNIVQAAVHHGSGLRHCRVEVAFQCMSLTEEFRMWLTDYVADWVMRTADDLPPRRTELAPEHAFTAGPLRAAAHCGFYHAIGMDDVATTAWRRAISESVQLRDPNDTLLIAVRANLADALETMTSDPERAAAVLLETLEYLERREAP